MKKHNLAVQYSNPRSNNTSENTQVNMSLVALFQSPTLKLGFDFPAVRSKASKYMALCVFYQ